MKKFLKIIVGLAVIGAFAYAYRSPLKILLTRFEGVYMPCENPITYKIESFDARFGISKDYFLSALRDAEAMWEKPMGRELFAYEPEGNLKINLIYDYRQQATATLQKLGLTVSDDKASYNALGAKYDALKAAYALDKAAFKAKVSDYKARQSAYEKEVAYWNARHGASKDERDRLHAESIALNAEVAELNQLQTDLNGEIDTINALVVVLNRLAASLNLDVSQFHTVGETLGSEFEEGNYQSGPGGQQIDIYEFDNRAKLVRVLAHELGHALGLGHVDDPNAIMYRLNNGINGELTAADLTALKKLCGPPADGQGLNK
jgi:hypothetical protein